MSTVAERLWRRAERTPSGCWEFRGTRNNMGYGRINVDGKMQLAHRLAYALTTGPIPDGLVVMHACDNPPCFNPEHLSVGTRSDNTRDAYAKGRQVAVSGLRHPRAKLSDEDVADIRAAVASGEHRLEVSARYGLHPEYVRLLISGRRRAA